MRQALILLLLLVATVSTAQKNVFKENNNWCFGTNAGVTFNTTPPSTFNTNVFAPAASATVSHILTGDLLFYVTNTEIRDKNNQVMPNGSGINTGANPMSLQGVQIAPFIHNNRFFYVFTLNAFGANSNGVLSYSIVDLSLNGGLGDVVANKKNIALDSGFAQALVVAESCSDYWLIVQKADKIGAFYAYKVDDTGVRPPVVSNVAYTIRSGGKMTMKLPLNKSLLAVASYDYLDIPSRPADTVSYVALHNFDMLTGQVTHGRIIDTMVNGGFWGCEFSQYGNMLYVGARVEKPNKKISSQIYQYEVTNTGKVPLTSPKDTLYSGTNVMAGLMQMAPDSLIYMTMNNSDGINHSLASIANTNQLYPGCTFTANAVPINGNKSQVGEGLPQAIAGHGVVDEHYCLKHRNFYACLKEPVTLTTIPGAQYYVWQDGSTQPTLTITQPGTYWVRFPNGCVTQLDTITVLEKMDTTSSSIDTLICTEAKMMLVPTLLEDGATHVWNTGSTKDSIVVPSDKMTYIVTSLGMCDLVTDSFNVAPVDVTASIMAKDTTICYGDTLLLEGVITPAFAKIKWNTEDTILKTKASIEARYILGVEYMGCKASDDVYIGNFPRINIELGKDREICADEPELLPSIATSEQSDKYLWQDGSNSRTFRVKKAGTYTVELSNQCETLRDTVNIRVRNCRLFFPNAFTPNGDGRNDKAYLAGDLANVTDYELHIFHHWGEEVFASRDISQGWDGTHNGQPAAMGTYSYYMKYKYFGEDQIWSGSLILLR